MKTETTVTEERWDRGPMEGSEILIITPTPEPFMAGVVARVPAVERGAERRAQLIAAAPAMFDAIRHFQQCEVDPWGECSECRKAFRVCDEIDRYR